MYLHTHNIEGKDTYILHLNREEVNNFLEALVAILDNNPEGQAFTVNLGHVLDGEEEVYADGAD